MGPWPWEAVSTSSMDLRIESDAPKNAVDVVHYDYKHKMDSGK